MSRHRNVRNMTKEDYYDDYDDYDDEYYEEEEDNCSYKEQQERKERAREQANQNQMDLQIQSKKSASDVPQQSESVEKVRLLQGLGFPADQAKIALHASNGDVQAAASILLTLPPQPDTSITATTRFTTTSAVTSHAIDRVQAAQTAGVRKPPPGFTKPKTPAKNDIGESVSSILSPPFTPTRTRTTAATKSSTKKQPQTQQKEYGTLPQISKDISNHIQEQRSRLSMVVLGHVDAGKSTLMGQLLLQLGQVQKRTVNRYQKQAAEIGKASFALAWVMDEDESERERGVTMEVGTKTVATKTHDLVILDAPGHADFIPSMITGTASADVGLLVVAATPGEFEAGFNKQNNNSVGGQTREHIVLARGLGVSQLIVAVNKLDAAEPKWNQGRFEEIKTRLLPFLQVSGFNPKRIRFVPISGLSGVNIKEPPLELSSWYWGQPTLLQAIDGFEPAKRNAVKPLRIILTDVYAEGKGVTTKGRVVQGVAQVGEQLVVLPIGDEATVARIEHGVIGSSTNDNDDASNSKSVDRSKYAAAGDNVEINLTGIDVARLSPGCILSHPHISLRPPVRKKMLAKILVMEKIDVPIIRGATALMHMHSVDVPAVLSKLIAITNRDGSIQKERPRVLPGGASATVEITLQDKICMEEYTDCRALGRFVLRRGGDTIALGVIEKINS